MKLQEILNPVQQLDEGFVPADSMLILSMLADGRSDNISHRFTLAHIVEYIKAHHITAERFRDIGELQTPKECIDAIRVMSKPDLKKLAKQVLAVITDAEDEIDQEGYSSSQDAIMGFIKKVKHKQD